MFQRWNGFRDTARWAHEARPRQLAIPVRVEADRDGRKAIEPLVRWGELKGAEPSEESLRQVWARADAATGIGIISRGLIALDPDSEDAEAAVRDLNLPPAPAFRSRRGTKRLFRAPEGLELPEKLVLRGGLELLGPGSLIIVPPTAVVGPDGQTLYTYEWEPGADLFHDFRGSPPPCPPQLRAEIERALDWKGRGLPGAPCELDEWTRDLLGRVEGFVRRYVAFPSEHASAVVTLFVAATHVAHAFDYAPMLHVWSAERRCGKSVLLDVLALLVCEPLRAVSVTPAALYRALDQALTESPYRPRTTLLDEVDNLALGREERAELLALLNDGYRRGDAALRVEKAGGELKLRAYRVFGPKVLAGIGRLPETLADRCFGIELRRKRPEDAAEPFRERKARPEAGALRRELEAWGKAAAPVLRGAEPELPAIANSRALDLYEPLAAVADLAGEPWASRARAALVALYGGEDDTESAGVATLRAIHELFDETGADRLESAEIVRRLAARDDGPWAAWWTDEIAWAERDGRAPAKAMRRLAALLEPFGVKPTRFKVAGRIVRGYVRSAFEDAWARYLPDRLTGCDGLTVSKCETVNRSTCEVAGLADGDASLERREPAEGTPGRFQGTVNSRQPVHRRGISAGSGQDEG